jgi:predicted nucleic acid-binding protein
MKPNFLVKLLWFFSGANVKVLEKCQVDQGKYAAIGFTIILTSVMASLSGGYALWTVFNSAKMAAVFGLFWGLTIGNLDRFLVSTYRKEENWSIEQGILLGIRVTVAISIAFVIAKPLELKIFEKPIRAELVEHNSKLAEDNQKRLIEKYSEIKQKEKDTRSLEQELDRLKQQRDQATQAVICEIDGSCGSNKVGHGPAFREKQQLLEKISEEYQKKQQDSEKQINEHRQRIAELTKKRDLELAKIVNERENANDIMTQLETLDELGKKKPIYTWSSFFITLIFVLIDVSPIIAKLFLKRGLYDEVLEAEEKNQLDTALSSLDIGKRSFDLKNFKAIQKIEQQEDEYEKMLSHMKQLQQDIQDKAFAKAKDSPEHQEYIDELVSIYLSKTGKAVARIGKELNLSSYTRNIKQEMGKQIEDNLIPTVVKEEVKHKKTVNKVKNESRNTLNDMWDYLTNYTNS